VHGLCKVFYNMCFNSINKKINKQIKKLLFGTEKYNMEKEKENFHECFWYYKEIFLIGMYGWYKDLTFVPSQYSFKTW
jgi:hypothetical protein